MSDVVVIGPTSLNEIVELDALPQPRPHTITARAHWRTLGGTSAGKALHLAGLGVDVTCVSVVGHDADADAIRAAFDEHGAALLALTGQGPSEHHLNLMTRAGERLSIYLDHAPRADLTASHRTQIAALLAHAKVVALDLSPLGIDCVDAVRACGAAVWVDLHDYDGRNPFHEAFLPHANVVLMNGDGMDDPVAFLRARVAAGAHAGVCTLGADGAVGVASTGEIARVQAVPTEVVDTNGAGDAFAAGMIASLLDAGLTGPLTSPQLCAAMAAGATRATTALTSRDLAPRPTL